MTTSVLRWLPRLLLLLLLPLAAVSQSLAQTIDKDSGLIVDDGFVMVKAHCTVCHSAKLVTQNRMSRDAWLDTIRWMQKSQGLWPLGDSELVIINYLSKNYNPKESGRRKPLSPKLMPLVQ